VEKAKDNRETECRNRHGVSKEKVIESRMKKYFQKGVRKRRWGNG
jgi:hypothetical protein